MSIDERSEIYCSLRLFRYLARYIQSASHIPFEGKLPSLFSRIAAIQSHQYNKMHKSSFFYSYGHKSHDPSPLCNSFSRSETGSITPSMLIGYLVVMMTAVATENFGAEWTAEILLGTGQKSPYQMILPHCLAFLVIGIVTTGGFFLLGIAWNYIFLPNVEMWRWRVSDIVTIDWLNEAAARQLVRVIYAWVAY
jgi:hypothetical protein